MSGRAACDDNPLAAAGGTAKPAPIKNLHRMHGKFSMQLAGILSPRTAVDLEVVRYL